MDRPIRGDRKNPPDFTDRVIIRHAGMGGVTADRSKGGGRDHNGDRLSDRTEAGISDLSRRFRRKIITIFAIFFVKICYPSFVTWLD